MDAALEYSMYIAFSEADLEATMMFVECVYPHRDIVGFREHSRSIVRCTTAKLSFPRGMNRQERRLDR